jgi:hypothetical protein
MSDTNTETSSIAANMSVNMDESVVSSTEHKELTIDSIIHEHLDEKLKDIKEVTDFHKEILNADDISEMAKIDYFRIYKVYESAVNNLTSKDTSLKTHVFAKLYNEIGAFSEFYKSISKRFVDNGENAANIFIKNTPELKVLLQKELEINNSPETKDKFLQKVREVFIEKYDTRLKKDLKLLQQIINIKFFYFDKVLWTSVNKSKSLRSYFEEINLQGVMSLKIYLKLYLRNVDFSKFNVSEWHKYLKKCMEKL